ncbi:MAG: type IX secretion system membrane protein PorP/SprF [Bacteroidia bacterium]
MKNYILLTFLLLALACHTLAQDPVGSQFAMQQGMYNPASIGSGLSGSRLSAFFRNQWTAAMLPYRSNGLLLEHRIGQLGLGVNMLQQKQWPRSFNQLNLGLQLFLELAAAKY